MGMAAPCRGAWRGLGVCQSSTRGLLLVSGGDSAQVQPGRHPSSRVTEERARTRQTRIRQGQAEGEGANGETPGGCWEVLLRDGAQHRSEDSKEPRWPQALSVRGLLPLAGGCHCATLQAVPPRRASLSSPALLDTRVSEKRERRPRPPPGPPPGPRPGPGADPQWESAQRPASHLRPGHLQRTGMGGTPSHPAQPPPPHPVST